MLKFATGLFVGAGIVVGLTSLPQVAPWYSGMIYDCGIRIGSGVVGVTITGGTITGPYTAVCVDGAAGIAASSGVCSRCH